MQHEEVTAAQVATLETWATNWENDALQGDPAAVASAREIVAALRGAARVMRKVYFADAGEGLPEVLPPAAETSEPRLDEEQAEAD